MRRGFKAEAERVADGFRSELGLGAADRLDPDALAWHVGAEVRCADELTDRAKLEELEKIQPGALALAERRGEVADEGRSGPAHRKTRRAPSSAEPMLGGDP